ncbi:MAG: T9SS type B sorting domain-containing protein, partial [Flavobacteriales bacterium]|nr:T9SS type B sorting domain-containing protein [Flavobacteriales bacterium]
SVEFVVEEFFQAEIMGIEDVYCYQNSSFPVEYTPESALFIGGDTDSSINPALADQGDNTVYLYYEGILCSSEDSASFFVHPPIESTLSATDLIICPGEGSTLNVSSQGGLPGVLFEYEWSEGLFPVDNNAVNPDETTTFYVATSDNCSDPVLDSITVEVLPPILTSVSTSDTACFGYPGWASVDVISSGNFTINWGTSPPIFDEIVEGEAGDSYLLEVFNDEEGCVFDSLVLIPNYTPIAALFSVNPNEECIGFNDNPVEFIDLSQHGLSGIWDFGNGTSEPYNSGSNPSVNYTQPGDYTITLDIVNEGNCPDSASRDICILPPTPIFIPDIFSPNNDGFNDLLFVRGQGIVEMNFLVYDRWGQLMFEATHPDQGWDGQHRGKPSPSGIYVYHLWVALNDGTREEFKGDITLLR